VSEQGPRHGHGDLAYLQIPATDLARSAAFYEAVFGWHIELEHAEFAGPNVIGQFTSDAPTGASAGPVLWFGIGDVRAAQTAVERCGGALLGPPQLDQGERLLIEATDPAGNRIGLVARARRARPQTLLAVADVEASSRFYQHLLGLISDHGGPDYERLLCDGELVLQLHHRDVAHHHGRVGDPAAPVGNGVLVWFGEVSDFDAVVTRAFELDAPVVREPHRNPPEGGGNGPGHRELWISDPDGYTVVIASPDGEAWQP
jgi:predicted enzyme related to lactoylglutathione lyase